MATNGNPGTMSDVMRYFGMKVAEFRIEWKNLTETDREQMKNGVGPTDKAGNPHPDATLTY